MGLFQFSLFSYFVQCTLNLVPTLRQHGVHYYRAVTQSSLIQSFTTLFGSVGIHLAKGALEKYENLIEMPFPASFRTTRSRITCCFFQPEFTRVTVYTSVVCTKTLKGLG